MKEDQLNLIEHPPGDDIGRSPEEHMAVATILASLRARRDGDAGGFAALLHKRIVYHDIAVTPAKGKDEARARVEQWRRAVPDLDISVEEVVVRGAAVVSLGHIRGTWCGDLFGFKGTGQRFDLLFAQLGLVRQGKILYVRDHWYLATMLRGAEVDEKQALSLQRKGEYL